MDPLSVAASITGLLIAGAQIVSKARKLSSAYSNTAGFAQATQHEILHLRSILSQLQQLIIQQSPPLNDRASMINVDQVVFTLTGCMITLSELEKEVDSLDPSGTGGILARLRWVRAESAIATYIQQLQHHKSSLSLMLTILTCARHTEAIQSMNNLHSTINNLVAMNAGVASRLEAIGLASAILPGNSSILAQSLRSMTPSRLSLENALRSTRLYKRVSFRGSKVSVSTSVSCTERLSVLSGISLSKISNISVYRLPIHAAELYNAYCYEPESPILGYNTLRLQSPRSIARQNKLIDAVHSGNIGVVQSLLEDGVDKETRDMHGDTVLILAAMKGNSEIVELLLEVGVGKEERGYDQNSALTAASRNGHGEVVRVLLKHGVDKEARDVYKDTALILAAKKGHYDVVKILLDVGVDKEATGGDKDTALTAASRNGHEGVVRALLVHGVDKEARDIYKDTALILAASNGDCEIVELLLEVGADKEARGYHENTALTSAVKNHHGKVVRILLGKGVHTEARDNSRDTALVLAARNGSSGIVRILLAAGADGEARGRDGVTPLITAVRSGHERVVHILLSHRVDREAKDADDDTALTLAIGSGNNAIVQDLLATGADSYQHTAPGYTSSIPSLQQ